MAYIKPTNIIVNGRGITSTASSATGISPVTLNVNTATTATLGIIQVGSGLAITPDGVLSATGGAGNGYTGSAGSNGSVGFTGSIGSTGTQGNAGFTGSAGSTGTQGSIGFTGSAAAIGYTGSAGSAGSTGPKISSVTVTDSSYNNLDDTAVALTGGYIKIAGSGFASGCQVLLGTTLATSVSYISSSEVRAQLPASSTGTYIIYLVNSDGGTAIRVNAVTFSPSPSWTTGAALAGATDTAISIQLAATDATSYSLAAGSSLPSGITLSSGGLLSGTITGLSADTAYNFTIVATDAELQDSTRAFTFTISIGDTYFKYVSMLLAGNGTNLAQNNTFIDSSTNNFSITRAGNTTQGTFTPYGPNWSSYNGDTNDSGFGFNTNAALSMGTGDFTVEAWVNTIKLPTVNAFQTSAGGFQGIFATGPNQSATGTALYIGTTNLKFDITSDDSGPINVAHNMVAGQWYHVAVSRSGNTFRAFINGALVQTATSSGGWNDNYGWGIQRIEPVGGFSGNWWYGYVSNFRAVKGTAVYTSAFTPSTTPLTAISGTSLLTCQSNRFKDNSSNNFSPVFSPNPPTIQRFSPFSPTQAYSASTIGGSGYFDGSDYLTAAADTAFDFGTGDFTIECWVYPINNGLNYPTFLGSVTGWSAGASGHRYNNVGYANKFWFGLNGSGGVASGDPLMASTNTFTSQSWYHYAITRSGNTFRMFVNGVLENTQTFSGSYNAGLGGLRSGWSTWDGGQGYFTGYLSNLRMVKGTAVYTSNFTPPTAPVTAITNTSILLNYTNAGIIDNTMLNNLETVGDAQISTAQSKFGSGSMSFDGTGDYLTTPFSPLTQFGTGDFTIEFWIYRAAGSVYQTILDTRSSGTGSPWAVLLNSSNQPYILIASDLTSSIAVASATWTHIAICRASGTLRIFNNGVVGYSGANSTSMMPTGPLRIGKTIDNVYDLNGYLDDLRITKGYARYTTTFTPATAAHPLK